MGRSSSLAANEYATSTSDLEQFGSVAVRSCRLLSIHTGWRPTAELIELRCKKARQMLDRLCHLCLSQRLQRKVVAMLVIPLLYEAEYVVSSSYAKELETRIKRTCWGVARTAATATNWQAACAICLPSHTMTPMGARHMDLCRSIWQIGSHEALRSPLSQLWNCSSMLRPQGLWTSFVTMFADAAMQLMPNGMHLHMSKKGWAHQSRRLWR